MSDFENFSKKRSAEIKKVSERELYGIGLLQSARERLITWEETFKKMYQKYLASHGEEARRIADKLLPEVGKKIEDTRKDIEELEKVLGYFDKEPIAKENKPAKEELNDVEKIKKTELSDKEKENLIASAKDFRDLLVNILPRIGEIVSPTSGKYLVHELIEKINGVRSGRLMINSITRTYGLRKKVRELLKKGFDNI